MTWKDRLQDASFRGVPFKVEEESAGTGRTATNPIPKIWEKSLSARPSQLMWWEMTALTSAIA